jgi:hypothetical protein
MIDFFIAFPPNCVLPLGTWITTKCNCRATSITVDLDSIPTHRSDAARNEVLERAVD